jgi:tRNA (guanine10-N2)-dimethyltransferase
MEYLFEFSGEHKTLPFAELCGILEAEFNEFDPRLDSPGVGLVKTNHDLMKIYDRPALCRSISELLFFSEKPSYDDISHAAGIVNNVIEGTFAFEDRRVLGHHKELSMTNLKKMIASTLIARSSMDIEVDLRNPDNIIKLILSKKFYAGILLKNFNRQIFESHHGRNRPFFSPISLHPKFARAMVNLARVRPGMRVLDPFCGTGGILIEGASIGMNVYGSDISNKMVEGTKKNLDFFKLAYSGLKACDVTECPEQFKEMDAMVSDPPYGRSTSVRGKGLKDIYDQTFNLAKNRLKRNRYLVIMLPSLKYIELGEPYLKLVEYFSVYVHRSLTRHICVYQN